MSKVCAYQAILTHFPLFYIHDETSSIIEDTYHQIWEKLQIFKMSLYQMKNVLVGTAKQSKPCASRYSRQTGVSNDHEVVLFWK